MISSEHLDSELQRIAREAFSTTEFYQNHYRAAGISEEDFACPDIFQKLPIISQSQLIENSVALKNQAVFPYRATCSGGTTNNPKILFRTREDTDTSVSNMIQLFKMAGVKTGDSIWIGQPFDLAHVGFLALQAAEELGLVSYPAGIAIADEAMYKMIGQFRPSVVFTSPSRMVKITDQHREDNNLELSIDTILLAGEPCSVTQADYFRETWKANVSNLYGCEEIDGIAGSCRYSNGTALHLLSDTIFLELVEPGTNTRSKSNIGEAVVTSLYLRGSPIVRYRLADVVKIDDSKCKCGSQHPIIEILGRSSATFHLFDGVSLHDFQVRMVLQSLGVQRFQVVLHELDGVDKIDVCLPKNIDNIKITDQDIEKEIAKCSMELSTLLDLGKLKIGLSTVDHLQKTSRGKIPELINRKDGAVKMELES